MRIFVLTHTEKRDTLVKNDVLIVLQKDSSKKRKVQQANQCLPAVDSLFVFLREKSQFPVKVKRLILHSFSENYTKFVKIDREY